MNEKYLVPVSILFAGLLIGGGLYLPSSPKETIKEEGKKFEIVEERRNDQSPSKVDREKDHILGDYDKAEIFIIEYSDTECPFCKRYNDESGARLEEKYGDNDKVAFVYRSFPLGQLHPTAATEAVGLECAAKLGGDNKFFAMKKEIFNLTKSNNKNAKEVVDSLPALAEKIGIDKSTFIACQSDSLVAKKVEDSFNEAIGAGVGGTPTVFVQMKDGTSINVPASADIIISSIDKFLKQF